LKRNRNACIVIPIYKPLIDLSVSEIRSIYNTINILSSYDIFLIGPKKLEFQEYSNYFSYVFLQEKFHDSYFNSIDDYSSLLLQSYFYKKFKKYKFLLIVQTDAWVFRDDLNFWCSKEYDFIGAPWFERIVLYDRNTSFLGVGNGGFSLRNVNKTFSILNRISYLKIMYSILVTLGLNKIFNFNTLILRFNFYFKIKSFWELQALFINHKLQEDEFYGHIVSKIFNDFKLAPIADAIKFSFEVNPRYLYELNNYQLSFGCHAWEKYDKEFWNNYIRFNQI
jgi:hypothetical protein